jgi:hypothetical protein
MRASASVFGGSAIISAVTTSVSQIGLAVASSFAESIEVDC